MTDFFILFFLSLYYFKNLTFLLIDILRNPQGGKIKAVGDFFSLKPIRNISSSVIPRFRSSSSHGRSSGSCARPSNRASLISNDNKVDNSSPRSERNSEKLKPMSTPTRMCSLFTGKLLSFKGNDRSNPNSIRRKNNIINLLANGSTPIVPVNDLKPDPDDPIKSTESTEKIFFSTETNLSQKDNERINAGE